VAQLGAHLAGPTTALIRQHAPLIRRAAAERLRDELVKAIEPRGAANRLHDLDQLGLLPLLLPAVAACKGVTQSPPHHFNVFEHCVCTVAEMEAVLGAVFDPSTSSDLDALLDPFADELRAALTENLTAERPRHVLLKLAALLHDVGKPETRTVDENGRIHFYGHEHVGARIAERIMRGLRFGTREVKLLETIVENHMRPLHLSRSLDISGRAIYRFFRDTQDAGPDTLLVSLADIRATWSTDLRPEAWAKHASVVSRLLTTYYREPHSVVAPPRLVSGRDLMEELGVAAGPGLGRLLEDIREAQAAGEIQTREEALGFARAQLSGT
jgi:putative nucleotidyltransferase with HDIG domain